MNMIVFGRKISRLSKYLNFNILNYIYNNHINIYKYI